MSNMSKIYTGSKFYRYIDGEEYPEIIRIRNIDYDKRQVKYFDSDGDKKKMSYDYLVKEYKMLSPDGLINFASVQVADNPDVIVALQPFPKNDVSTMDNIPYAICRQMVADVLSNLTDPDNFILGSSISKDTCPVGVDYKCLLACSGLNYNRMVAIYLDDTLDEILRLFDNTIFDKVFDELSTKYPDGRGICTSLRELLESNHFMYDFRKCFNIIEVPGLIDESSEALSEQNIAFLEKELKVNILETYLIKYNREVNFAEFKRDYVLVSSAHGNFSEVYIVGYDKA